MILAADFGGTTIKLGLVENGAISARAWLPAHADRPMADRLEAVARAWEKLLEKIGRTTGDCKGATLALPFLIDPKQARVLGEFGKFPQASAIDFAAWSHQRLGLSVAIENDLRVALLGEWQAGAARGKENAVMLALGTGIGCAVICNGRLLHGANNRAAMLLGHSTVNRAGRVGRCGNIGCAEDLASTATLPALARAHREFPGSLLERARKIDYQTLFELAAKEDDTSRALIRQSLRVWSVLVQNAILAYDPEIVVLGGGVMRSAHLILPAIRRHLARYMPGLPLSTPLAPAALSDDAALIGGEVLFTQSQPTQSL